MELTYLIMTKFEIAGICSLNDAKVALCGLKSLDLTKESIKNLGAHISYNKKLHVTKTFERQSEDLQCNKTGTHEKLISLG